MIFGNWRPRRRPSGVGCCSATPTRCSCATPAARPRAAAARGRDRACSPTRVCRFAAGARRSGDRDWAWSAWLFLVWFLTHRHRAARLHRHDALRRDAAGARASPRQRLRMPAADGLGLPQGERRDDVPVTGPEVDWDALHGAGASRRCAHAYAPYSRLPGRCRRARRRRPRGRRAATSRTRRTAWRCAPSAGWSRSCTPTGGGRLTHFVCVNGDGAVIMPCGRCRQLLFENGGPDLLLLTVSGVRPMDEVLPDAFGPDDLDLT